MNIKYADDSTALYEFVSQNNIDSVRLLLKSGADVNRKTGKRYQFEQFINTKIVKLLFVAGEEFFYDGHFIVSEFKSRAAPELTLHNLCRESIRKHLQNVDLHENLFCRIPKLGLPSLLVKYLLYNLSLDDEDNNYHSESDDYDDDDDDGDDDDDDDDDNDDDGDVDDDDDDDYYHDDEIGLLW